MVTIERPARAPLPNERVANQVRRALDRKAEPSLSRLSPPPTAAAVLVAVDGMFGGGILLAPHPGQRQYGV